MRLRFPIHPWRRLHADERGVAAIEFALVVPVVIVVYLVGFEVAEASTAYRKLTDTTVQLANVTAQYTTMSCTDIDNVLAASAQIMTPYPTTKIAIVLSEVSVDSTDTGTTVWSEEYQGTRLPVPSTVPMPAGYQSSKSGTTVDYMMVKATYSYQPTIGAAFIGPIAMQNQIFMLPRASSSIPETGLSAGQHCTT
jgi:Flp pilus assembly protein TadG